MTKNTAKAVIYIYRLNIFNFHDNERICSLKSAGLQRPKQESKMYPEVSCMILLDDYSVNNC